MFYDPNHVYQNGKFRGVTLHDRLMMSFVEQPTGCWEWVVGRLSHWGYGVIYYGGKSHMAHRVSAVVLGGMDIAGMCVLHRCDNPKCINPSHLFLGTQGDNVRDREQKGRGGSAPGERNGRSRIDQATALGIFAALSEPDANYKEIALRFGVSNSHVCNIKAGRKWATLKNVRRDPEHCSYVQIRS